MTTYFVHWIASSLTVMVMAHVVPGIKIQSFVAALLASAVIGFINMFVWPILAILTLPLTVITFGLFLFVVNGIALKIAAALTPGFTIEGFFPAVVGSIVLTVLGWLVRFVFFQPETPVAFLP